MENLEKEIWRDAKGFENYYEVSNCGRIRRKLNETIYKNGTVAHFSQTILKQSKNKKGYFRVYLSVKSKKYTKSAHRIIAETFIENIFNKATINHIDCDKTNNHISNLEWCSNLENIRHAFNNGIFKNRDKNTILNIKHMKSKLCK